eukprot:TRINITY_DN79102_c0_g1_i1.p1 TRINITY_DN79102_c0_g1~~TRINITY_DN79102_c0_g1_i1.p1  ORF type:complete len:477 (-),score=79.86 TRINITY_DN79102_c0_g1_i1:220-1650(-)
MQPCVGLALALLPITLMIMPELTHAGGTISTPALRGSSIASTSSAVTDTHPLAFVYFVSSTSAVPPSLRIQLTAEVEGVRLNFLMDSGSSTVGLCNGTEAADGMPILADPKPPFGTPTAYEAAIHYGAGCHGYDGPVFLGSMSIGNTSVSKAEYVVMRTHVLERGNACGLPQAGSIGAKRFNGIFGIAGHNLNFACKSHEMTPGQFFSSTCLDDVEHNNNNNSDWSECLKACKDAKCNGEPMTLAPTSAWTKFPNPFQQLLESQKGANPLQFGIHWSGGLGEDTGTLFMGDSAAEAVTFYAQGQVVEATMTFGGSKSGSGLYYCTNITGYTAFSDGEELSGAFASFQSPLCTSSSVSNIVDTGNPTIAIPNQTYQAVERHFEASTLPVVVTIKIAGPQGNSDMPLEISAALWSLNANLAFIEPSGSGIIGLPIMLWYQYLHFDIFNDVFHFVPRTANELQELEHGFTAYLQKAELR